MRVSSAVTANQIINSSQFDQQQLATLQQEISSGADVQFASDNPLLFQQASQTQASLAQLNAFTTAASSATTQATANNTAMTSLHKILAQASELATSVTGTMSTADIQAVGTEMSSLLSQVISTVNQKSTSGNYLFGGTSNTAPIDATTQTYNTGTNAATTSVEVGTGNSVQTSIVAGRSTGSPAVDGFLTNAATGVDVLATLKQAVTDLQNGNATAVQSTDIPALNKSLDLVSQYVGSTAATMSAINTATNSLQSQIVSQTNQLNGMTQTNLPNATLQLQQIQNQYQASLSAGSRILGLSILNFMGSIPAA